MKTIFFLIAFVLTITLFVPNAKAAGGFDSPLYAEGDALYTRDRDMSNREVLKPMLDSAKVLIDGDISQKLFEAMTNSNERTEDNKIIRTGENITCIKKKLMFGLEQSYMCQIKIENIKTGKIKNNLKK